MIIKTYYISCWMVHSRIFHSILWRFSNIEECYWLHQFKITINRNLKKDNFKFTLHHLSNLWRDTIECPFYRGSSKWIIIFNCLYNWIEKQLKTILRLETKNYFITLLMVFWSSPKILGCCWFQILKLFKNILNFKYWSISCNFLIKKKVVCIKEIWFMFFEHVIFL